MTNTIKTATISTNRHGDIVALDSNGNVIASKSRYCNPSALAQVICAVEIAGHAIDWNESDVANPESAL
jgi:hypothetical protein